MADKPTIRIQNIKSFTHGEDRFKGIHSIAIRIRHGRLRPKKDEGEFYVTGKDRLGISEFPVEFDVEAESVEFLTGLLFEDNADVVVVGQADGEESDKQFTFNNVEYDTNNGTIQRDQDGMYRITGRCVSNDGDELPFDMDDVAA